MPVPTKCGASKCSDPSVVPTYLPMPSPRGPLEPIAIVIPLTAHARPIRFGRFPYPQIDAAATRAGVRMSSFPRRRIVALA